MAARHPLPKGIRSEVIPEQAIRDPKSFYDDRYRDGYMQGFEELYEACRLKTIDEVLRRVKDRGLEPRRILDYGCGEGRYISVLKKLFPRADVFGSDISDIALEIARGQNPGAKVQSMVDEGVDLPDGYFDLVISVEVLEHVLDATFAAREMARVLRSGGTLLVTTPCANKYSLEWFYNRVTGGLEPSDDGYGRFASDEPAHLRRLTDTHVRAMFSAASVDVFKIYHRAHFVTLLAAQLNSKVPAFSKLWKALAYLDWQLFKHFPNGATMVALGKKVGLSE